MQATCHSSHGTSLSKVLVHTTEAMIWKIFVFTELRQWLGKSLRWRNWGNNWENLCVHATEAMPGKIFVFMELRQWLGKCLCSHNWGNDWKSLCVHATEATTGKISAFMQLRQQLGKLLCSCNWGNNWENLCQRILTADQADSAASCTSLLIKTSLPFYASVRHRSQNCIPLTFLLSQRYFCPSSCQMAFSFSVMISWAEALASSTGFTKRSWVTSWQNKNRGTSQTVSGNQFFSPLVTSTRTESLQPTCI